MPIHPTIWTEELVVVSLDHAKILTDVETNATGTNDSDLLTDGFLMQEHVEVKTKTLG